MIKNKLFIRGAVLGLLIPSIVFMSYSLVRMDGDFVALYYELDALNIHSHVMSLCVLANAIPFFIFIKSNREKPAQGILMITILFALLIFLDKLL